MGFLFYLLAGIGIMIGARVWQQNNIVQLPNDYKIKLIEIFTKKNKWSLYLNIFTLGLLIIIFIFNLFSIQPVLIGFILANVLSTTIPMNINYNKLVKAEFPTSFINNYVYTSALRVLGTIVIFLYLFFEYATN